MKFEFATAARIIFGSGTLAQVPAVVREFGTRALLVTGADSRRANPLLNGLTAASISISTFACPGEPTVEIVRSGARAATGCDIIIGFGGGSAIDCAKAIAAVQPNSGEALDYLEVVGKGRSLEHNPLPFIAIPTTAGTGAEVTRNAVISVPERGLKASLRSPLLYAKAAVVDPDLTRDAPANVTASTGLDTLTQLIEPFVSSRANVFTDMLCREGLPRVARSLEAAFRNGDDMKARTAMSYASLLSGLALANAGLGVVHGFAAPLGGMLRAPHGALCAAVLPHGMAMNIGALNERAANSPPLEKYREIARILTGNPDASVDDGANWVAHLCQRLSVPPLRAYGLTPAQIPVLVENAARASSMKANPIALNPDELTAIALRAL